MANEPIAIATDPRLERAAIIPRAALALTAALTAA